MNTFAPVRSGGVTTTEELEKIAIFYGALDRRFEAVIDCMGDRLDDYLEIVFAENHFEVITGGASVNAAEHLASIADLTRDSTESFLSCAAKYPSAMTGLKLAFGDGARDSASLYVRTMAPCDEVFDLLRNFSSVSAIALDGLQQRLAGNRTFYGLGFYDLAHSANGAIKTYTLDNLKDSPTGETATGFVSHRIEGGKLLAESKEYFPDQLLAKFHPPNQRWEDIVQFLDDEMAYTAVGHVGRLERDGHLEYKVYVERIGAIPTDFDAQ